MTIQVSGEMVTFNEEIVKVRKLEDTERKVVAEQGRFSIERVTTKEGDSELILLSPGNEGQLMHLLGIPPESEIELALVNKFMLHILATSSSGKQYYTTMAIKKLKTLLTTIMVVINSKYENNNSKKHSAVSSLRLKATGETAWPKP